MHNTIYLEYEILVFLVCTTIFPVGIFLWLMWKRRFSRTALSTIGILLVILSGIDAISLQRLQTKL